MFRERSHAVSDERVSTPQAVCRAAVARCDITPPIGIYHRMWGAALHDKATGVHKPLTATLLWLAPAVDSQTPDPASDPASGAASGAANAPQVPDFAAHQIIVSLDHCILDTPELERFRASISHSAGVPESNVLITVTHTHGSGWMSRKRSEFPGGELIGPYLDELCLRLASLAASARPLLQPASIVFGFGRCSLAAHRDYFDHQRGHAVCGFHPPAYADDTVLTGLVSDLSGKLLATVVNYACHPTTLAWDNTLLSPDWIGAMRETIEEHAGGLCLFLQGASGDLGPREGFTGDTEVADRNGRQLGFSVLATLEALPKAGTEYVYSGPVLSGTWIGTWKHQPCDKAASAQHRIFQWKTFVSHLPYRHDLPTLEDTAEQQRHWLAEEEKAKAEGNTDQVRLCRANAEQMTRQLARLNALTPGKLCPIPVTVGLLGNAVWVFVPGELYQVFQMELRARFTPHPVFVTTLTGDWQPGYIPPASSFGYGVYQEVIAATSPGSLELLIEDTSRQIRMMLDSLQTKTSSQKLSTKAVP